MIGRQKVAVPLNGETRVESWDPKLVTSNGQHLRLPGYALIEIGFSVIGGETGIIAHLYHPETPPATGHIDVIAEITPASVVLRRYAGATKIEPGNDEEVRQVWPTGLSCLLMVLLQAEKWLIAKTEGLEPILAKALLKS